MNSTIELLNRVRVVTETGTDYAIGKALGVSRSRMSRYMKGMDELADDATIARAAELIGDDPAAVLAEFHAEKAKSEKSRFYWKKLATLARATAPATLAIGVILSPTHSEAFSMNTMDKASPALPDDVYYVKSWLARRRRAKLTGTLRIPPNRRRRRPEQLGLFGYTARPLALQNAH